KAAGLHLLRAALPARHPPCMAMVAIGIAMLGMMAGVIGAGVPPCAVVRPCRSRRDECDDGHRTQCQRDETKRPAKRKQLTHTKSSVAFPLPLCVRLRTNTGGVLRRDVTRGRFHVAGG